MSGRRAKRERRLARAQQAVQPARKPAVQQSMPQRYEQLHYRGNVTGADRAQPGQILGHDELGRPYEVLDAEYEPDSGRTTVNLQYATPDNLRAALAAAGITPGGAA